MNGSQGTDVQRECGLEPCSERKEINNLENLCFVGATKNSRRSAHDGGGRILKREAGSKRSMRNENRSQN